MIINYIILGFIFITGLCVGSFLNVVILRCLSGESIVLPASKCPKCQHPLYWWHNIPLLSYLILRGKCAFCKEKISIQYPIIEFLTGVVFVLAVLKFGLSLDALFACIITCLLVIMAMTDIKEKIVFDVHTYSLIGIGLFYNLLVTGVDMYQYYSLMGEFAFSSQWFAGNHFTLSLCGVILGFVIMEIISRAGYLIAGNRAFGEGDSFIAAGLGAVFGWRALLFILALSVAIQMIITLPLFYKKEIIKKHWASVILLSSFLIIAGCFFYAQKMLWLQNIYIYIVALLILIVSGIFAVKAVLEGIRDTENQTYLPFGPALVTAGLLFIIF